MVSKGAKIAIIVVLVVLILVGVGLGIFFGLRAKNNNTGTTGTGGGGLFNGKAGQVASLVVPAGQGATLITGNTATFTASSYYQVTYKLPYPAANTLVVYSGGKATDGTLINIPAGMAVAGTTAGSAQLFTYYISGGNLVVQYPTNRVDSPAITTAITNGLVGTGGTTVYQLTVYYVGTN